MLIFEILYASLFIAND